MGDYNRDLIAVQVLLLSCALHCVLSSVGMTCLISFFCWGGGIWQAEWRRWSSGRVEEQHSDQLAELVVLHSKLCGDLSNTISFFLFAHARQRHSVELKLDPSAHLWGRGRGVKEILLSQSKLGVRNLQGGRMIHGHMQVTQEQRHVEQQGNVEDQAK